MNENKPICVLIIEDNPDDALLIKEILSETVTTRYHVEYAERLSQGIQTLENNPQGINLVLLDLGLPDCKGIHTLRAVKPYAPHLPIVVLTALGHESLGRQAIQEGAQDYICKNEINVDVLENSLRFAIERHRLLMKLQCKRNRLEENERRFRRIIEKNADGIMIVDQKGSVKYLNPTAEKLIGTKTDDIIRQLFKLNKDESPTKSFSTDLPDKSIEWTIEPAPPDPSHDPIILEMRTAQTDWMGEPVSLVSLRDVTLRKTLEKSLSIEKERLDITLRSIADGVITTDREGLVVSLNTIAEKMTGWTNTSVKGIPINQILCIDTTINSTDFNYDELFFGTTHLTPNSPEQETVLEYSAAPILDKEDQTSGYIFILRDISLRKKVAEEIVKCQKLESLSVVAGKLAHEYDNVFTVILGNISFARNFLQEDPKIVQMMEKAEKSALKARDLTEKLHTFSNVSDTFQKNGSLLQLLQQLTTELFDQSVITCRWDYSCDLWQVEFDKNQVYKAFRNILINAEEAMPRGGLLEIALANVVLSVKNRTLSHLQLKNGSYLKITITDHGHGMEKETLKKIFDPFFTTRENHTGMGLTTAFSILRKHNGTIEAQSTLGAGTTITVFLPAYVSSSKNDYTGSNTGNKSKKGTVKPDIPANQDI